MFQLLDLIFASPLGTLMLSALQDSLYAVIVVSDCEDCGFNDLGKLLFGGVLAAILVGVVVSLLYQRARNSQERSSQFVSIRTTDREE